MQASQRRLCARRATNRRYDDSRPERRSRSAEEEMTNPLLAPWTGPYGLPPFAEVRAEHFAPAFAEAMREHLAEIDAIGSAAAAPTFANTVAALDSAGRRLERIGALFHNLTSSETSPALQAVEREMAPILAGHDSRVYTHAALFARIDALHAKRALARPERRADARARALPPRLRPRRRQAGAARARALCRADAAPGRADDALRPERPRRRDRSSSSSSRTKPISPACPTSSAPRRARRRRERGLGDVSVITLSRSHIVPFLTFSERRDLREQAWRAWTSRGEHPGASDNRGLAERDPAACASSRRGCTATRAMPTSPSATPWRKNQAAVAALLERVWKPARARAEDERAELAAVARAHGRSGADRALGLALLRREGAARALSPRRGRDQALLLAREHGRRGVRLRRAPVRPGVRRPARDRRVPPRRPRLRGAQRRRASRSACSCTTTSPVRPSAAAPG